MQISSRSEVPFVAVITIPHSSTVVMDTSTTRTHKISRRAGAVKYTDFAIGELLREAAVKPWSRNTVLVIVADHCASVAGKAALPVQNYHISLMIHAPGGQIAPGRVESLMSQVDYAPTLLSLLNGSYASRFFGWYVVHADRARRALIRNDQRVGLQRTRTTFGRRLPITHRRATSKKIVWFVPSPLKSSDTTRVLPQPPAHSSPSISNAEKTLSHLHT